MKIETGNARHWTLLLIQALYTLIGIVVRPFLPKPPTPLVVLYGHSLSGNLHAIYEYWSRHDDGSCELCYLTLDPGSPDTVGDLHINLLKCHRFFDMLKAASASVFVTDHALHAMYPMVYLTNIKFVDVWHGIPFKGFDRENCRKRHGYTEIWVTSGLLRDIYIEKFEFRREQVFITGYARTDMLVTYKDVREPGPGQSVRVDSKKLVLYAPTWSHGHRNRSMFPFGLDGEEFYRRMAEVCEGLNALFAVRSHQNATLSTMGAGIVRFVPQSDFPNTESLLLEADILISDWSSIVFDYLVLERPTIFLDVPAPFPKGFTLGPDYRFGEVTGDLDTLARSISTFLTDPDIYRHRHCDKYLSVRRAVYDDNADGHAAERCMDRVRSLLRSGCPSNPRVSEKG